MNKHGKKIKHNILLFAAAIILGLSFVTSVDGAVLSTVDLEQTPRCGAAEHQHTDECYSGSILTCGKENHTHSSSCYLLLLEDNDVNAILENIENTETQSLESLMESAVESAVTKSGNDEPLTVAQVNKLNESADVIDEGETDDDAEPVVLNENMKSRYGQVQILAAPAMETDQLIMAAAAGPVESGNYLNFYIYLDGQWTFLDSMAYNYNSSMWSDDASANRNDILNLINNNLGTSFTRNNIRLSYSTSENSSSGQNTSLGSGWSETTYFGDNRGPIYVRVVANNGSWTSTSLAFNTLTLVESDTVRTVQIVRSGTEVTFPDKYFWSANMMATGNMVQKATISSASTYYAYYRVYFIDGNGARTAEYIRAGNSIMMPNGYWWGKGPSSTVAGGTYVQITENNQEFYSYHQVKIINGSEETIKYIRPGNSITLDTGLIWTDNYGNTYDGGTSVKINRDTTFISEADTKIIITYNVNFPTVSGVTVSTKPNVMGDSTHSGTVEEGQTMTVHNVSESKVKGSVNNSDNGLSRVIQFKGWKVNNSSTILKPGTTLTYEGWKAYGNRITLTGVWEYSAKQTVSFFVSYDSQMKDSNGNYITAVDRFTPEIHASFLENLNTSLSVSNLNEAYRIDANNYNNAGMTSTQKDIQVDKDIRNMLNPENGKGIYLLDFPTDEYVFEQLKKYANNNLLSVDGIKVKAEDLHDHGYTIRWFVFKSQDDAWHVDGKLVRKIGKLEVSKTFAGNADAIEMVKKQTGNNAFYIEATNGTTTHKLTLSPDSYKKYNEETNTYTWVIDNILYNEEWTLHEHNYMYKMASGVNINPYAEYIVVDATGEQSTTGQLDFSTYNPSVTIKGMTYAEDAGSEEIMSVDFTNIYRGTDSIIIKKEDTETGRPLGGAKFKLVQNGTELKFTKTSDNVFVYAANGSITEIESTSAGFAEVSVNGLDFSKGNIQVHETQAPSGYVGLSGDIVLTKDSSGKITITAGANLGEMEEGVLVIGNTSKTMSVTINKTWADGTWTQNETPAAVQMQLLANGRLVSTLVSNVVPEVTLDLNNNFTYTWTNLPVYANGSEVQWSAREVKIGSEQAKADFTFSNWIATYSQAKNTGTTENPAVTLDVLNTRKEGTALMVIKEGKEGERLSGAVFELQFKTDSSMSVIEGTTNNLGVINFSNLPYGQYTLTEKTAPIGYYKLTEPILLTINDNHTVSIQSGNAEVRSATDLVIAIKNIKQDALPETGGSGTAWLYMIGALLMTAGAVIALIPYYLRKERNR